MGTDQPADGSCTHARRAPPWRRVFARFLAAEVVIERDSAVEVRERDVECVRGRADRLLREISVSIVKRVKQRQQRCRLAAPTLDQVVVRRGRH